MSILDRLIKKVDVGNTPHSQAHPVLEVAQMHRRDIRDIMPIEEVVPLYLRAPDAEINWATWSAQ